MQTPASERADVFIDDIYLQFGTQARIEIGERPVYTACESPEVQEPTTWSDASITVSLNQSSLPGDQRLFLFVVRDDGEISEGYQITFR